MLSAIPVKSDDQFVVGAEYDFSAQEKGSFVARFAELNDPDDPRRVRIISEVDSTGFVEIEYCGGEGTEKVDFNLIVPVLVDCSDRKVGTFMAEVSDLKGLAVYTAANGLIGEMIEATELSDGKFNAVISPAESSWGDENVEIILEAYDAFISEAYDGTQVMVLGETVTDALSIRLSF